MASMSYRRGISRKAIMAATVRRATIMEMILMTFLGNMSIILQQNEILLKTVRAAFRREASRWPEETTF